MLLRMGVLLGMGVLPEGVLGLGEAGRGRLSRLGAPVL